jgi:hypothetical protein
VTDAVKAARHSRRAPLRRPASRVPVDGCLTGLSEARVARRGSARCVRAREPTAKRARSRARPSLNLHASRDARLAARDERCRRRCSKSPARNASPPSAGVRCPPVSRRPLRERRFLRPSSLAHQRRRLVGADRSRHDCSDRTVPEHAVGDVGALWAPAVTVRERSRCHAVARGDPADIGRPRSGGEAFLAGDLEQADLGARRAQPAGEARRVEVSAPAGARRRACSSPASPARGRTPEERRAEHAPPARR